MSTSIDARTMDTNVDNTDGLSTWQFFFFFSFSIFALVKIMVVLKRDCMGNNDLETPQYAV